MQEKVYLAIPYSFHPDYSFEVANEVAAILMKQGKIVFSPISHSHKIADHLPSHLKTDSDWWMEQDLPLVQWANKVIVVVLPENGMELIAQSKGVRKEISFAKSLNKPIEYYHYGDD